MRKIAQATQENVKKEKKVCILGYAPHLKETPFQDESWELWGINSLYRQLPEVPLSRFSAWFEIHSVEFLANRADQKAVKDHFKVLSEMKMPLYMKDHYPMFPSSVKYPINEVIDHLKCSSYFTNTISYMIALAIVQGYTDIAIFGVDMAVGGEYEHQRPSCEYFIGRAEGAGIQVYLPDTCDLLKTNFLYGIEDTVEDAWMKKLESMAQVIKKRENEAHQAVVHNNDIKQQYIGAKMAMDEVRKVWGNSSYLK